MRDNNFQKEKPIRDRNVEDNSNVVAGRNAVIEALKSGRDIEKIFMAEGAREGSAIKILALAKEKSVPVVTASHSKILMASGVQNHQGVMAYISVKEYCSVEDIIDYAQQKGEKPFIAVLDSIEDEGNLGAIIRSANVLGVHGIIIPKRNAAGVSPIVAKVASGALEYVNIAKVSNIAATIELLKKNNIWVFGADGDAKQCSYNQDFDCPCAIVIGNEGKGISRLVKEKCDFLVSIPMKSSVGSLNASCAAAVLFYEVVSQRNKK